MIHSFASIVDHVWKLNLQAALLAVIVGAACLIARRWLTPGWRSALWMLVFVRVLIPLAPNSMFSLGNIINASFALRSVDVVPVDRTILNHAIEPDGPGIPAETGPQPVSQSHETEPVHSRAEIAFMKTASRWSAREACTAIWLIVAVLLLGRLGWLKIQLAWYLSRLEVIRQAELIQLAESAAADARLTRVPRLLWASRECSPAVCGWLFPVLILPRDSLVLQSSQLRAVLLHEFRHVRAGDTLLTWLPRVLCAAFWFNPLLWFASRKWHEERELSCDEWVLRQIGQDQKRSYLETLVAIATRTSPSPALKLTAGIVSSYSSLERRIVAMKRFHPSTRSSLIAGSLVTVLAGAIGLTDAAQQPIEHLTEPASAPVATANTNQDTTTQAADPRATDKAAPDAKLLKPKVVFAQHVILWEGTEIVTRDQLKERLAKLRSTQPVKPSVYYSLGFMFSGLEGLPEAKANERLNKASGESLQLIGSDQWSSMTCLSRRGSGAVDRIRTDDDLKINSVRSLKGRVTSEWMSDEIVSAALKANPGKERVEVVVPIGPVPVKGAQVVILPLGEPCVIRLRDGKLRDAEDEIWYETSADGTFQADPAALTFDPVLLYGEGKYLTLILHPTGYRVINGQLAASDATYELLPWSNVKIDAQELKEDEQVEIWMTPRGAHEEFPELSIGWVGHSNQPVTVKLPRGNGRAAYWRKAGDQWNDAEVRHPIQITGDGPKEITLPALP